MWRFARAAHEPVHPEPAAVAVRIRRCYDRHRPQVLQRHEAACISKNGTRLFNPMAGTLKFAILRMQEVSHYSELESDFDKRAQSLPLQPLRSNYWQDVNFKAVI
jgi:hypothetical protein